MRLSLALVVAFLLAPSAYAAGRDSNVVEQPLVAQSLDSFNQEAATIRQQMQTGGVYEHTLPADKARVETCLADIQKLLQKHATQMDMPQSDKVALANAQEEVNGILRHNDNKRLVCENRAPLGSHVAVTTCRTYGEIMVQRAHDQKFLQDRHRVNAPMKGQ